MRLSQHQMQVAADGAALEGLRQRDSGSVDDRLAARDRVSHVFDDDFNTFTDDIGLGAGPIINLSAPLGGGLAGGQNIVSYSIYDPLLELNTTNEAQGDILTGNYDASQRHDEGYNLGNYYTRDDFPANFDEMASLTPHDSFLVRIRRTNDPNGLDNLAGISSSGPSLPYLFGRGAFISADGPDYNPRTDGVSFAAVSIADAQPALSVGPLHTPALASPSGINGLSFYALDADYWNLLTPGVYSAAQILADGSIVGVGITTGVRDGQLVRRTELTGPLNNSDTSFTVSSSLGFPAVPFTARINDELMEVTNINFGTMEWTVVRQVHGSTAAAHAMNAPVHLFESSVIGDQLLGSVPVSNLVPVPTGPQFIPIFQDIAGAGERITGFGAAMIQPTAPITLPLMFPIDVEVQRLDPILPDRNASARLTRGVDSTLTQTQVEAIFLQRSSIDGPIVAPALVQSY